MAESIKGSNADFYWVFPLKSGYFEILLRVFTADSDLTQRKPCNRTNSRDDSVPGKGRESMSRNDPDKRLDHDDRDNERRDKADTDLVPADARRDDRIVILGE